MKILTSVALLILLLFSCSVFAQQKTTGEIIAENYQKGRAMRRGLDERRVQAQARREQEDRRADEQLARRRAFQSERAYNNPSSIFSSKNDIPDILVSDLPANDCTSSFRAAFTTDKNGDIVLGCASVGKRTMTVIWMQYGTRTYDLDEWIRRGPTSTDKTMLGN